MCTWFVCLVATLDDALFGCTKGNLALQKDTFDALTSTFIAIVNKNAAICKVSSLRFKVR